MSKADKLKSLTYELLNDQDEKLSENTKKSYYQRLNWLRQQMNLDTYFPEKIVEKADQAIKAITDSNVAVSSKALTAVHLKQLSNMLDLDDDIKEKYTKFMNDYTNMSDITRRTNILSGKKKERFVPWPELQEVFAKMPDSTFTEIQDKIIVGLYTRLKGPQGTPAVLRLDFANVQVHDDVDEDRDYNWFLHDGANDAFYLNQYKTNKSHGAKIFAIEDSVLEALIDDWLDNKNKSGWLLVSYKDHTKPLNEASLSKRIETIFEKYLGKKVNNGMIRIAVESHIINDPNYKTLSLNDQIKMHENQLHSFQMAHEYSKKDTDV